jgi:hypothetical protein
VEIDGVTARHRESVLSLNRAHFYLKRGGGLWGELIDLEGKPLWPDADFQKALPPVLGKALTGLNVRGAVGLKTNVTIDSPPEPAAIKDLLGRAGRLAGRRSTPGCARGRDRRGGLPGTARRPAN